ncbi:hypothetical protein IH970_10290 [candidate division KSB1 bacterium]|nr:hypothetical protein [candidate division KSB1 bacterium]
MSKTPPNSNFVRDKRVDHLKVSGPVLQDGFPGIPNGEVTPPDPVIAAGPSWCWEYGLQSPKRCHTTMRVVEKEINTNL